MNCVKVMGIVFVVFGTASMFAADYMLKPGDVKIDNKEYTLKSGETLQLKKDQSLEIDLWNDDESSSWHLKQAIPNLTPEKSEHSSGGTGYLQMFFFKVKQGKGTGAMNFGQKKGNKWVATVSILYEVK